MLLYATGLANPLPLLLAALVLDLVLGEVPPVLKRLPHPVVLAGRAIHWFDRHLNRERRDEATRRARGVLTVGALIIAAAVLGALLTIVLHAIRLGWALEVLLVAVLLAQRSLYDHVAAVRDALLGAGLAQGREAVSHIVGRDPESLDEHGVARAAIESLVENFSDGVVAPALYYALFGLPGILVYKMANTLDSMIGHRTPRYLQFGWAAARLDDLLNLAPARLAGVLLSLAAIATPQALPLTALRVMLRDARKHRSPNAGWPEAAAAGALGLAFAGPRRYRGEIVDDAWLGDGRARATAADIDRALRLYLTACALQWLLVAAAYVATSGTIL